MAGLLLGDVGSYILLCCFIVVYRHMFGGVCHGFEEINMGLIHKLTTIVRMKDL